MYMAVITGMFSCEFIEHTCCHIKPSQTSLDTWSALDPHRHIISLDLLYSRKTGLYRFAAPIALQNRNLARLQLLLMWLFTLVSLGSTSRLVATQYTTQLFFLFFFSIQSALHRYAIGNEECLHSRAASTVGFPASLGA